MGKFFANQKQDAPGLVGITLQKLLIFFMVLDVFGMFCGGSFFTSFLTLLFHFVVFMGVYRRRTAVLCMYVVVHIVLFVIVALVLIVLVSSLMYMPYDYSSDSYSSGSENWIDNNNGNNYTSTSHTSYYSNYALKLVRYWSNSTTASNSTASSSSWNEWSDSWDSQDEVVAVDAQALFLFSVIFLVFAFIITYTKILSVVLAHRMRKMILSAPALPCHHDADAQTMEPTYVPADFEAQQQMFANQFAYAPMAPQNGYPGNQGAMMPPPFMYGNQPVFYTFAPMPPQQAERNEKL